MAMLISGGKEDLKPTSDWIMGTSSRSKNRRRLICSETVGGKVQVILL
jgi:hypothetical protein